MKHIVMFSGGIGSWAAAKRVVKKHGSKYVTLLFADTLIEDPDLYRFIDEAAENMGASLVKLKDGRTPWEVYRSERFLGNSRIDPCSKLLKRVPIERWLKSNCEPEETQIYVGIDWSEEHRFVRVRERNASKGWIYNAPLCEPPFLSKQEMFESLESDGIRRPKLYSLGFAHNNCGGFCCKAGQGHFANLLRTMPELYNYHELEEESLRKHLGKDVSIMLDRRGGARKPLTMREFRARLEKGLSEDHFEVGGCGCFTDEAVIEGGFE